MEINQKMTLTFDLVVFHFDGRYALLIRAISVERKKDFWKAKSIFIHPGSGLFFSKDSSERSFSNVDDFIEYICENFNVKYKKNEVGI